MSRKKGNYLWENFDFLWELCGSSQCALRSKIWAYFSLATTKSGAHSSARLISESGKALIAF